MTYQEAVRQTPAPQNGCRRVGSRTGLDRHEQVLDDRRDDLALGPGARRDLDGACREACRSLRLDEATRLRKREDGKETRSYVSDRGSCFPSDLQFVSERLSLAV